MRPPTLATFCPHPLLSAGSRLAPPASSEEGGRSSLHCSTSRWLALGLKTAAALLWVVTYLVLAQVCVRILVILIIYNYWFLYIPYFTWLYFGGPQSKEAGDSTGSVTGLFGGTLRTLFQFIAHLVPVFSFGENDLFKQINNPEGSWLRTFQEKLQKIMGFALLLFYARGIFQYSFGLVPYQKPIHTVVGCPIPIHQTLHPTPEQIEELHQTYMEELRKLFEEHKGKYRIPEHETLILK